MFAKKKQNDVTQTEQGVKEKKPIYKRKWFIVLMVFVVFGMISSCFGSDPVYDRDEVVQKLYDRVETTLTSDHGDQALLDDIDNTLKYDGKGLEEDKVEAEKEYLLDKVYEKYEMDENYFVDKGVKLLTDNKYEEFTDKASVSKELGLNEYTEETIEKVWTKYKAQLDKEAQQAEDEKKAEEDSDKHIQELIKKTEEAQSKVEGNLTTAQKSCKNAAENYLSFMSFSRKGLADQLAFDKYSESDIEAVLKVLDKGVDWNEQAYQSALNYLDTFPMSQDGLIEQLEFDGYTSEQAQYGAQKAYK